jgi:hypothetical protein
VAHAVIEVNTWFGKQLLLNILQVPPTGFEPVTLGLEGRGIQHLTTPSNKEIKALAFSLCCRLLAKIAAFCRRVPHECPMESCATP